MDVNDNNISAKLKPVDVNANKFLPNLNQSNDIYDIILVVMRWRKDLITPILYAQLWFLWLERACVRHIFRGWNEIV